jgi:predicted DCC family thiol-disulfide oxidoreductase YuxK
MPLQGAGEIVDAPPVEVLLDTLHVRDPEGRWSLGGAAWIRIAADTPLLRPLAALARVPAIRGLVEWAYARVAANRHRISHLLGVDACAVGGRTDEQPFRGSAQVRDPAVRRPPSRWVGPR